METMKGTMDRSGMEMGHGYRYRELTAGLSSCLTVQEFGTGLQALITKVWKRGSYLLYLMRVPKSYAV